MLTRILIGLCNVKRKESEKGGEREREERGGRVGIDAFFFFGTEFMVVKTYIKK